MFKIDGKLFTTLSKIGDLLILNVLWLIGCIPVVTIGVSTASMYHCCIKCVRRDRSKIWKEFWRAYKLNLKQGIFGTLIVGALLYLATILYGYASVIIEAGVYGNKETFYVIGMFVYTALVFSFASIFFPVLSRFSMKFWDLLKMSFLMSVRYIVRGIAAGAIMFVVFYFLLSNFLMILFLPAPLSLLFTFFFEPVLLKYIKRDMTEGVDDWYFEGEEEKEKKRKKDNERTGILRGLRNKNK